MKKICLNFQIHQPFRLKRYRFFSVGNDHYYYDDYANESYIRRISDISYLPANKILLETIKENKGKIKVSFSISGTVLDQFELYAPDVLDSFRELADTGCVEFVGGTDAHSLASLVNREEFETQVNAHKEKIQRHFGKPVGKVFCNSNMIYSNDIGAMVGEMGFRGVLTEGAKHILGWKSPNYMYCSATNPRLKLLLRNYKLSDDIRFNFSNQSWVEYPLTADKFVRWLELLDPKEEIINLSLDYATFGEKQTLSSGIFEFLRHLPKLALKKKFTFVTPDELLDIQPVAPISIHYPISWTDEERDLTAWRGNELQLEAFDKLYGLAERVKNTPDPKVKVDWKYLQASDHFRFMSTKFYSTGRRTPYNPYESPYDAFINYMNILSDFTLQLQKAEVPAEKIDVDALKQELSEKDKQLKMTKLQLDKLRTTIAKAMQDDDDTEMEDAPKAQPKKKAVKKTETKEKPKVKTVAVKKTSAAKNKVAATVDIG
ncbi:MAG: glycoside hydrolase family 57 protein [Bacteroidales bacterium]|jgi:alpha-amylase|nr:glycoside hydrolase family 57 protein [Bacteroidales bacterium]